MGEGQNLGSFRGKIVTTHFTHIRRKTSLYRLEGHTAINTH